MKENIYACAWKAKEAEVIRKLPTIAQGFPLFSFLRYAAIDEDGLETDGEQIMKVFASDQWSLTRLELEGA